MPESGNGFEFEENIWYKFKDDNYHFKYVINGDGILLYSLLSNNREINRFTHTIGRKLLNSWGRVFKHSVMKAENQNSLEILFGTYEIED